MKKDLRCRKCGQIMINPAVAAGAFQDFFFCETCDAEALADFEQFMEEENLLDEEERGMYDN